MERSTTIAAWLLATAPLLACSPSAAARETPTPAPASGEVVAEAEGVKVTREELDRRVAERLTALRQQEYEIRRQALDEMLADRLVEKEAGTRGIESEAVLQEAEAKAPAPSEAEVAAFYEQNKQRLPPGMSREQALAEIQKRFRERNVAQARASYRRELLDRAGARVRLEPPRSKVVVPAAAPAQGPEQAPITIVQFSDYQCPYCQRSEGAVQDVLSRYSGKIRLVHRDFPLEGHTRAFPTSRAAYCAGEQGRFWEYHRGIFLKPSDLSDEDLKRRAGELGLDAAAFGTCLASDRHDATIRGAFEQGVSLGVTGTPTFFINGRLLVGARPFEQFKGVIDEELARP